MRENSAITVIKNRAYLYGGRSTGILNDVNEFDFETKKWR